VKVRMAESLSLDSICLGKCHIYPPDAPNCLRGFFMAGKALETCMHRALELAEKGRGLTSPNPMVGAVVVKNNRIVGEGYHRGPGKDHAEIVALKKAGKKAIGAVLYVTLEPCCHTGRTGPCTNAIIKTGIKKVVTPLKDPNPLVNGQGLRLLKKAGVIVETGILKHKATLLNDAYLGYHKNQRPYIILKTAQTLDGRIATVTGDSRWVSSPSSLAYSHRLRAEVEAVVVGMGTVRQDNPALTVRHVKGKNPYRIVLSRSLNFPPRNQLLNKNADYKTIVVTTEKAAVKFGNSIKGKNLIIWTVKTNRNGMLDLHDFLIKANKFGLQSLMVEGGGRLATSFWKHRLVDKYVLITAPKLIGNGIDSVGNLNIKKLSGAIRFKDVSNFRSGVDNIFIGYPCWE